MMGRGREDEIDKLLEEMREEERQSFKVVFPKIIRRRRRGKIYERLEIIEGVPRYVRYVIMPLNSFLQLTKLYEDLQVLKEVCRKLLVRLETETDMLREWIAEHGRYIEQSAIELEREGKHDKADLYRFRINVYTNELKFRLELLEKIKKMLEGIDLWRD